MRLGHFDLQPLGREADFGELRGEDRIEGRIAELDRRDIHRKADARPIKRIAASSFHHEGADLVDEAALLGNRHEDIRRHEADLGMQPAYQRLDPARLHRGGVEDRLIDDREAVLLERLAQLVGKAHALGARGVDRRVVEGDAVAAELLGEIHRDVGAAQQFLGADRLVVGQRDADAGADLDEAAVERDRIVEKADEAVADLSRALHRLRAVEHDGELVAADTGEKPDALADVREAVGDMAQQIVARLVAIGVVDFLEAIEIEIDQPHRRSVALARLDRRSEGAAEG